MPPRAVSMHLKGGEELKARLSAITAASTVYLDFWAANATTAMQARIYSPTGRMRRSIHPRSPGQVWADFRVTFIDKGTTDHGPRHAKMLKIPMDGGQSVYKKRVRGQRRRPFIRTGARKAYSDAPPSQVVIDLWNDAGVTPRKYILGAQQAARRRYAARRARLAALTT